METQTLTYSSDTAVAEAWGLTPWQWAFTLTSDERANLRLNVSHAVKAGN